MNETEKINIIVKILERYRDSQEEDYCCNDVIDDIADVVGFSFAL